MKRSTCIVGLLLIVYGLGLEFQSPWHNPIPIVPFS